MAAPHRKASSPSSRARWELLVILLIALAVFLLSSYLDFFEWLASATQRYEGYDLDEIVVLCAILSFAFAAFAIRRWVEASREYARRLEGERMKVILEAAGTVSHEFNQPLQVIMGNSELALAETAENSKLRKYLSDILDSAKRIADLIVKFNKVTAYRTKHYYKDQKILDLD